MIRQFPVPHEPFDDSAEDAPVVKLSYGILEDCLQRGAERIHIFLSDQPEAPEPYKFVDPSEQLDDGDPDLRKTFIIRAFVNGAWEDVIRPPVKMFPVFLRRLEVMASFSYARRRPIEEGRFRFLMRDSVYEIAVTVRVRPDGTQEAMIDLPPGPIEVVRQPS